MSSTYGGAYPDKSDRLHYWRLREIWEQQEANAVRQASLTPEQERPAEHIALERVVLQLQERGEVQYGLNRLREAVNAEGGLTMSYYRFMGLLAEAGYTRVHGVRPVAVALWRQHDAA